MMKTKLFVPIIFLGLLANFSSCVKQDAVNVLAEGNFADTTGTLKGNSSFPIGFGIDYTPFLNNARYKTIVAREGSSVTFGYHMKHGALVQNDGSIDFTKADALYNAATAAGLEVYGHTLGWHSNQNATYLKNYAKIVIPASTELLSNPGFETTNSSLFANWSVLNTSLGTFSAATGANVHAGSYALKCAVTTAGSSWKMQILSDAASVSSSKTYTVSFFIKADAATTIQFELRNNDASSTVQYVGSQNVSTGWSQITYNYTPKNTTLAIAFDLGATATNYYIDDVSIKEAVTAPSGAQVAALLDAALNDFITKTVTHYKGEVKAWDVINEILADNGAIRNNSNTDTKPADVLVWSNYLGKSFGVKAFTYAHAADPSALLFINDYALESNNAKVDSLVAYVNYLKANGVQVDGIGTQMHININTSYAGIDNAFQKLAATGLKVRISELDVCANPLAKPNFLTAYTKYAYDYQANMYKYVVDSYIKNVPAAQRYGVTIWGVDDPESWIIVSQGKVDAPLLFDKNFAKKPAYSGVLKALQAK
ncbi:MAG: endo-1,4-beta-xylanase [Bacteroidota bacterium]|nr:endo-1,4-beta-xylanase [Bacteroidota bacterium]